MHIVLFRMAQAIRLHRFFCKRQKYAYLCSNEEEMRAYKGNIVIQKEKIGEIPSNCLFDI